jgi:LysM repeat protein
MIARGMGARRQISLRVLAPLSLGLFSVVFLVIVVASLDGGSSSTPAEKQKPVTGRHARPRTTGSTTTGSTTTGATTGGTTTGGATTSGKQAYVVKAGDTLVTISVLTGVPLERLRELNPTADPQALVTGQRIKLR